jgi:nucleoside-diphosphate-sugar epimerase
MKFFILGCNGMAGNTIALYLKEQGHEVLGFGRSKSAYFNSVAGDAFDTELLSKIIAEGKFDHMVAWQNNQIISVPIAEAIKTYRNVDPQSTLIKTARGLGICLGD